MAKHNRSPKNKLAQTMCIAAQFCRAERMKYPPRAKVGHRARADFEELAPEWYEIDADGKFAFAINRYKLYHRGKRLFAVSALGIKLAVSCEPCEPKGRSVILSSKSRRFVPTSILHQFCYGPFSKEAGFVLSGCVANTERELRVAVHVLVQSG